MIINSKERLESILDAQRKCREVQGTGYPNNFYRKKIESCWARARAVPAYGGIGEYSWESFLALPPTTKERFKAYPWNFVATLLESSTKYYETTGTMWKPTPAPRPAQDAIWHTVSVASAWSDVIGDSDRVVSLLPSDVAPVGDLITGVCEYLDVPVTRAYPVTTGICDWDRLAGVCAAFRPTVVFMAPGVALRAAGLFAKRGQLAELSGSVRSVMLLGEVRVPALRARLGQWWGADVYDASYGSTETGTLAATCRAGRLHLLTAANYFEIAPGTDPMALAAMTGDDSGRLIVTPLNRYAHPLLRYDTGDEVSISSDCDCGRATPVLTILGRTSDGLRIRGAILSPHLVEEIVYSATPAMGYLLETDRHGSGFRLLLERAVDSGRHEESETAAKVATIFRERAGLDCDEVLFVDSLPTITHSGGSQESWKQSNVRIADDR